MLKFNGIISEYYSYENYERIKRILELEQFCEYSFIPSSQWIELKIDRYKCIRLKDLIYQIQNGLIKFHLGQLLQLIKILLQKIIFLESQNIEHNYLDMSRIWLVFKQNSQLPNIIHQIFDYKIHFIGYECKFFEKQNDQQKFSAKEIILQIIQELLTKCFDSIEFNNNSQKGQVQQLIIQPILQQIKFGDIQQLFSEVITIQANYNYSKNQTIKFDEQVCIQKFNETQKKIISQMISIISKQENGEFYFINEKLFINNVRNIVDILNNKTTQIQELTFQKQQIKDDIQERLQLQKQTLKNLFQIEIHNQIKLVQEIFKFQFDNNQISIMEKEYEQEILKSPSMLYFFNNAWTFFNIIEIGNHIQVQLQFLYLDIIKNQVRKFLKLSILQLINDLI